VCSLHTSLNLSQLSLSGACVLPHSSHLTLPLAHTRCAVAQADHELSQAVLQLQQELLASLPAHACELPPLLSQSPLPLAGLPQLPWSDEAADEEKAKAEKGAAKPRMTGNERRGVAGADSRNGLELGPRKKKVYLALCPVCQTMVKARMNGDIDPQHIGSKGHMDAVAAAAAAAPAVGA
jgi:hypothetical protein